MSIPGRALASAGMLAAVAAVLAAGPLESARTSPDEAAVRTAVQAYFDGMMKGDVSLLQVAFHPTARLMAGSEKGLMLIEFEKWSASVPNWAPGADADGYSNEIVSVDVAGDAAVAKTKLEWPTVTYIDYLSLVKIEGEWKIVNKIWNEEAPETETASG